MFVKTLLKIIFSGLDEEAEDEDALVTAPKTASVEAEKRKNTEPEKEAEKEKSTSPRKSELVSDGKRAAQNVSREKVSSQNKSLHVKR